jgi:hypothetical protein
VEAVEVEGSTIIKVFPVQEHQDKELPEVHPAWTTAQTYLHLLEEAVPLASDWTLHLLEPEAEVLGSHGKAIHIVEVEEVVCNITQRDLLEVLEDQVEAEMAHWKVKVM